MAREAATTFTFRLHGLFPPDDLFSLPMLRLMAAVNDVRHLRKLIGGAFDGHDHAIGTSERLVIDGEIGYLQRMLCGHLYEAGIVFRSLEETARGRIDELLNGDEVGLESLAAVRAVYRDEDQSENSYYLRVLGKIRTFAAFHYKQSRFADVLEAAQNAETTVVICGQSVGLGRHTVVDSFATKFVLDLCGGTPDDLGNDLGRAVQLGGALETMLEHMLARLMNARPPGAIVAMEHDEVTVPDWLDRLR